MGFWGIEVKPRKPHPYHSDNVKGTLHVSQATLGLGSSTEKCILQCSIGHKSPIYLCTLIPDKVESCSLNLEYNEEDLVTFSVIGSRNIHLSGYFVAEEGEYLRDEYDSDSLGEDIAETETDESSDYDSENQYFDDDFIDDDYESDFEIYTASPAHKSGVVIKEISEDEKPAIGNDKSKQQQKKNQSRDSEDKSKQIVVKSNVGVPALESEDEDGFPVCASLKTEATHQEPQEEVDVREDNTTTKETVKKRKKKKKTEGGDDPAASKKRKVKIVDQDGQVENVRKIKKKQKGKHESKMVSGAGTDGEGNDLSEDEHQPEEVKSHDLNHSSPVGNDQKQSNGKGADDDADSVPAENSSEKKKKKNKKKRKKKTEESENKSALTDKQTAAKSPQVRTFGNGLVIEEVAMGKPDGRRASPGNKVSVHYIGRLKKNGKIFDSNIGRAPFQFRLGVGAVIKGWDVGVSGMRVGDKRRLTIPPSMGYGSQGAGGRIPPNAWLEFDVELVHVR